ncbi:MAG: MarR family transcriptional regulator [Thermanaerothrix sp.]|nr:MarR family transcriptional regulator [Thermanaerothrix sp.]
MNTDLEACVQEVLDVVMGVSRTIRGQMRRHRDPRMSVPQFRALIFIRRQVTATASGLAEHLGLTRPSTTALVDNLVRMGWVERTGDERDRRRVCLRLTAEGEAILEAAQAQTHAYFRALLSELSPAERECVVQAMQILRRHVLEQTPLEVSSQEEVER